MKQLFTASSLLKKKPKDALESSVEERHRVYAKSRGWLCYKFKAPNRKGVPDRIFLRANGQIMFIEFKRKNKKPTELQLRVHDAIRACGFLVFVIDDADPFTLSLLYDA